MRKFLTLILAVSSAFAIGGTGLAQTLTVEQRLAALESDNAAIKTAVAKLGVAIPAATTKPATLPVVTAPVPDTSIAIAGTQWKAVHLDSGVRSAERVRWLIDGKAREGFNAAFIPTRVGQVVTAIADDGTSKTWKVTSLAGVTLKPVAPGVDIAPLMLNGARLQLAAGTYKMSRPVNQHDLIVVGAGIGKTIVQWTGIDRPLDQKGNAYTASLFDCADSTFSDITFDSTRRYVPGDWSEQSKRPRLFWGWNDLTINNVAAIDFDDFLNCGSKPSRVLVSGCTTTNLREYFVWMMGTQLVIYDNLVPNSIFQHIVRGGPEGDDVYGYSLVALDGNSFANIDRTAQGDPCDVNKGTIVGQGGQLLYRHANVLNGPSGVGPLPVGDHGTTTARTTNCVVADDQVTQPCDLWPGLSDSLLVNTPCVIQIQKSDSRRVQRIVIQGLTKPIVIPAWADAITQKAAA